MRIAIRLSGQPSSNASRGLLSLLMMLLDSFSAYG